VSRTRHARKPREKATPPIFVPPRHPDDRRRLREAADAIWPHLPGTRVIYWLQRKHGKLTGDQLLTTTRTASFYTSSGDLCVMLTGHVGAVFVSHLELREP
jgi:hypothetical protein